MIQPTPYNGQTFAGMKIGLLGGSFNPAHKGHMEMSLHALKQLGLDQIWWLVSPQNPLKSKQDMAPLAERMASAQAITAAHPNLLVTDLETQIGTRYTYDTINQLQRLFPSTHFVFLMGADNLQQIHRWQHWQDIFRSVAIAVFRRPGYWADRKSSKAAHHFARYRLSPQKAKLLAKHKTPAWLILDNKPNDISSTAIRRERALRASSLN